MTSSTSPATLPSQDETTVISVPRVAVIGLGTIASTYGTADEVAPYCHVGGLGRTDKLQLHAVADMGEAPRQAFTEKWGATFPAVKIYDSSTSLLESASLDEPLDIIAVCVRGPYHFTVMKEVLEAAPRTGTRSIFLEKPPTASLEEMEALAAMAREKGVTITVSYSRHWAPHVLRLEELVREGLIGEVRNVVGYCGGLILSFASHTTDLVHQFALAQKPGHAVSVAARAHRTPLDPNARPYPAGFEQEPSLDSMVIEYSNGVLGTQIGGNGDGGGFYVDVFGTEGRVRAGIYLKPEAWDANGKPVDLGPMPAEASVFKVAYEQIAVSLNGGSLADCTDAAWHEVNEIGFAAIESAIEGGLNSIGPRIALPNVNRSRKIWADG